MKVKVFTLRLDAASGHFDDADVTSFLAEREALSVTEHFFVHEQVPTLLLVVTWREGSPAPRPRAGTPDHHDPAVDLAPDERALYDALRRWRAEKARQDGRPSYIYLTNQQMADIARARPRTLADLGRIRGIGEGKTGRFGAELLALVPVVAPEVTGGA